MNRGPGNYGQGEPHQRGRAMHLDDRDPYRDGHFMPTATPGINRAIPSSAPHVIAQEAPWQYWRVGNFAALAPGAPAQELAIEWRSPGEVIGVQLISTVGTTQSICALGIKISAGPEQVAICMNGLSGVSDFVRFASIVGLNPQGVAPMYRPVCQNDKWIVSVQNFDPAITYTPEVCFHFRGCR
jgi:hypothetical protein